MAMAQASRLKLLAPATLLLLVFTLFLLNHSDRSALPALQHLPSSVSDRVAFLTGSTSFRDTKSDADATASPRWLILTSTPITSFQRRFIIRSTWQRTFHEPSLFRTLFVVSAPPSPQWASLLAAENATYGDILLLPHLPEDSATANTQKSIEMLKHLSTSPLFLHPNGSPRYDFVSKIDDDSYLDPLTFHAKYLAPLSSSPSSPAKAPTDEHIAIGRPLTLNSIPYPGGQFYTLTTNLALLLAQLHTQNPLLGIPEDVLVGRLLHDAQQNFTLIPLPNREAFDYNDDLGAVLDQDGPRTAWARDGADLGAWVHAVGEGAINPHKMRADDAYLRVADCFGREGVRRPSRGERGGVT